MSCALGHSESELCLEERLNERVMMMMNGRTDGWMDGRGRVDLSED